MFVLSLFLVQIATADVGVCTGEPCLLGCRSNGTKLLLPPWRRFESLPMLVDRKRVQIHVRYMGETYVVELEEVAVFPPKYRQWHAEGANRIEDAEALDSNLRFGMDECFEFCLR
jgi:hypothetical protein